MREEERYTGENASEKRYYITKIFYLPDGVIPEEKKEFCGHTGRSESQNAGAPKLQACEDGKNAKQTANLCIHYVEEEVTYMADYETDENDFITGVHYDAVVLNRTEDFAYIILERDGCE